MLLLLLLRLPLVAFPLLALAAADEESELSAVTLLALFARRLLLFALLLLSAAAVEDDACAADADAPVADVVAPAEEDKARSDDDAAVGLAAAAEAEDA